MITATALIEKFKLSLSEKWGYIWGTAGSTWTQAKQEQKVKYMRTKYGVDWQNKAIAKGDNYYQCALYGSRWIGHTVSDCSGLFYYWFNKLGGYMYHGSDTMFRKYTTANGQLKSGKRSDGKTLKPGTAVFEYNKSKDNYSHVGLYVGNGTVIECANTKDGVKESKVSDKKWLYWGELKGVSFSNSATNEQNNSPADPAPGSSLPTLKKGSKGEYVTLLQTKLIQKGYSCGSYGVDGDFGSATESAVKKFQKDNKLTVDGVVGQSTWAALEKQETAAILYTLCIPHLSKTQVDALISQFPGSYSEIEGG